MVSGKDLEEKVERRKDERRVWEIGVKGKMRERTQIFWTGHAHHLNCGEQLCARMSTRYLDEVKLFLVFPTVTTRYLFAKRSCSRCYLVCTVRYQPERDSRHADLDQFHFVVGLGSC